MKRRPEETGWLRKFNEEHGLRLTLEGRGGLNLVTGLQAECLVCGAEWTYWADNRRSGKACACGREAEAKK